jgi:hypothetical protein
MCLHEDRRVYGVLMFDEFYTPLFGETVVLVGFVFGCVEERPVALVFV